MEASVAGTAGLGMEWGGGWAGQTGPWAWGLPDKFPGQREEEGQRG